QARPGVFLAGEILGAGVVRTGMFAKIWIDGGAYSYERIESVEFVDNLEGRSCIAIQIPLSRVAHVGAGLDAPDAAPPRGERGGSVPTARRKRPLLMKRGEPPRARSLRRRARGAGSVHEEGVGEPRGRRCRRARARTDRWG